MAALSEEEKERCCRECGLILPVSAFYASGHGNGRRTTCKKCCSIQDRAKYRTKRDAAGKPRRVPDATRTEKTCSRCKVVKPISEFYQRRGTKCFGSWCKPCEKVRHDAWITRNPYARALSSAARKEDFQRVEKRLTHQEWLGVVADFNSCCAYCLKFLDKPTIDHLNPISMGGAHTAENVVPSCKPCNSSKHNLTLLELLLRDGVAHRGEV